MESQRGVPTKLDKLDALRGLLAFYVYLHHTIPLVYIVFGINIAFVMKFGQEAVMLFFLLSGFVINYSVRQWTDRSAPEYYFKRSIRIYIPLVPVLIISYCVQSYTAGAWLNPQIPNFLANILMLQDWAFARPNVIADPYMSNVPLWSLSYEWWFYMLYYPLFTLKCSRVCRDRIVFLMCVCAALLYLVWPGYPVRVIMYLGIWWSGVRLSDAYIDNNLSRWSSMALPLLALSACVIILGGNVWIQKSEGLTLLPGLHPVIEFRHLLFSTIAICVALLWHRLKWLGFRRIVGPFLVFAPISYTLYIVHGPLAHNGTYLDFIDNKITQWIGYFVVTMVVSYLIEVKLYPLVRRRLSSLFKNTISKPD